MKISELTQEIKRLEAEHDALLKKSNSYSVRNGDGNEWKRLSGKRDEVIKKIGILRKRRDQMADRASHRRKVQEVLNQPKKDTYKPFAGLRATDIANKIA